MIMIRKTLIATAATLMTLAAVCGTVALGILHIAASSAAPSVGLA